MNQHDDIDDEDGWECPTCLRPMQDEHDYECGTCEAKASEHIRVTTMCKLLRASQTRESCLIVERDRLKRQLDAERALADRLAMSVQTLRVMLNALTDGHGNELGAESLKRWKAARAGNRKPSKGE